MNDSGVYTWEEIDAMQMASYGYKPEARKLAEAIAQRNNAKANTDIKDREWPEYEYNRTGEPRFLNKPERIEALKLYSLALKGITKKRKKHTNKHRGS